ncbi:MAG: ribose 5-phosphate isomerase A [Caldisphaera sp.]|jgi:ribose 5-phosphate isomerase A|nr:ribose 5-phosphate isomerase A [Caldisphaera sp.]PMP60609.1 MAG: ribose 5-phosphate isomerase A [Caldisphaera sp.]PMP89803.1 MAG: ribose 5-phosphate isomerase A [Caldisphaera sp.]
MECDPKKEAAKGAVELVKDLINNFNMIGLGTGNTIKSFIDEARSLLFNKKIISSSNSTTIYVSSQGFDVIEMPLNALDYLYIDGADEFTKEGDMIKGGGGALLGEKILAFSGKINIFVVGEDKLVNKLGEKRPVPIEIVPKSYPYVLKVINSYRFKSELRQSSGKIGPVISDWGGFLLDISTGPIENPYKLNNILKSIPGVIETGIFLGYADYIVVGKKDCGYYVIKSKRKT